MPEPTMLEEISSSLDLQELDPRRVLVIGANPSVESIRAVSWEEFVASNTNVADFSLVVLVLESFDVPTSGGITHIRNALNPRYRRFLQGPSTELVVVGLGPPQAHSLIGDLDLGVQYLADEGDNITFRSDEFSSYLGLVDRYTQIVLFVNADRAIECVPLMLASERDALSVVCRVVGQSRVVFLPSPTRCDLQEGVETLLVDHYGLSGGVREPPDWLEDETLPAVLGLEGRIGDLTEQISPLQVEREQLESQLGNERRLLGVLYEAGTQLESLVRDLLVELGAIVMEPPNRDAEDGTLETPSGQRVVYEVKGRRGPIRVGDARQLFDWVNTKTYIDEDSEPEDWKGLLIGNPFCDVTLDERDHEPFGAACLRFAEREGLALVTTVQLITALRQHQSDELEQTEWWDRVVASSGVVPE